MKKVSFCTGFTIVFLMLACFSYAQQITGVWKGRINAKKVEVKIIKTGDSLVGTSYYYDSKNNYRRYAIKGYFDPQTNGVIWWDDQLIENKTSRNDDKAAGDALLSVADFNCPGEDEMRLDGSTSLRDDKELFKSPVNLEKVIHPSFPDEWDFVIENYTQGTNDTYFIDSINHLRSRPPVIEEEVFAATPVTEQTIRSTVPAITTPEVKSPAPEVRIITPEVKPVTPVEKAPVIAPVTPGTVENKFTGRKKVLQHVIPITAKKIQLRFYDNGIIDGDSIAIFLNGRLLYKDIRLATEAFTINLNASDLQDDNEMVMVAQNLGSIPPNTSLMVVEIGNKTYEARLYANENSSALVRFVKNVADAGQGTP